MVSRCVVPTLPFPCKWYHLSTGVLTIISLNTMTGKANVTAGTDKSLHISFKRLLVTACLVTVETGAEAE